jgi:hypothetical protein
MLFKGPHGAVQSTLSGPQILAQSNTDEFIENTKECAKITGNLDLWYEMFGDDDGISHDSAFMDDNYGG